MSPPFLYFGVSIEDNANQVFVLVRVEVPDKRYADAFQSLDVFPD